MRRAFPVICTALLLIGCRATDMNNAEKVAFGVGHTKRCFAFDQERSKAHQRLGEIADGDLARLHEINRLGHIICRESIDQLIDEITAINEKSS